MANLSPEILTIIMMVGLLIGVLTGIPLALPIGAVTVIVGYGVFGISGVDLVFSRVLALISATPILAAPLFIFMGGILERSGIAEKMFDALYLWLGGIKGGLAIITILIGTILAACVGIIAASIAMLALTALPAMIERGYAKSLASASVCAGGCLGILIPPSVMLVIYGPAATISVGKLFMGAFLPGFLLSALYMTYIFVRCLLQPNMSPSIPVEERTVPLVKKIRVLITAIFPVALLIFAVLGVIFMGIAAPTEAAASGALVALILAILYKRFNLKVLKSTALETLRLTSMIFLIGGLSFAYVGIFLRVGGGGVVQELILSMPGGRWGAFAMIMFICFILGFFIDWLGIIFIMVPIITPIAQVLGFDPIWFAIMICVNFQTSFMTPPFAPAIFYISGIADKSWGITMGDVIRGVIPFVILVLVCIGLCVAFPQIVTWLPAQMIK